MEPERRRHQFQPLRALRARISRQAGPRNTTQESSKFLIYKNLVDSCLRILRSLQFDSATLRGQLVSDASQLLPLIWHYAYRPKPNRFWQLLLVYRHIHHRTRRPRVLPYIAKKDSAHRCHVGKASPSPVHPTNNKRAGWRVGENVRYRKTAVVEAMASPTK